MTVRRWAWLAVLSSALSLPYGSAAAEDLYWVYTVRPGDTIWDLAARHTTSVLHWKRIQRVNALPDRPARGMVPGTRLKFPMEILKHQPASAQVRLLHGDATLATGNGAPVPVTAGAEIRSGDRLQVPAGSNVTVRFADGSELLVTGGSDVVFDSLSAYGETGMVDTRIRLQSGAVDTRVKSRKGPGSRYEIITPAAVAAVRGTDFRVSAEAGQPVARSEVLEGVVAVSGSGTSRRVAESFGVVAEAGREPSKPIPLLPAPDLSAQSQRLEQVPLQFGWQAVDSAQAYRYQVARSTDFDSLLANRTSDVATGAIDDLPNGEYVLRVRAIDANGLEGLNAVRPFTVAAHPRPPLLSDLRDGKVVRAGDPVFSWQGRAGIRHHRLQLATDAGFEQLVVDQGDIDGAEFSLPAALAPGRYYWRVASVDAHALQGPWSDVAQFGYVPLPAAPEFKQAQVRRWEIDFHWTERGEGARYRFQLAEDRDFLETLVDETVTEARLTTHNPGPDQYYMRVRTIDADGVAGNWSATQTFDIDGNPWQAILPGLLLIF